MKSIVYIIEFLLICAIFYSANIMSDARTEYVKIIAQKDTAIAVRDSTIKYLTNRVIDARASRDSLQFRELALLMELNKLGAEFSKMQDEYIDCMKNFIEFYKPDSLIENHQKYPSSHERTFVDKNPTNYRGEYPQ